MVAGVAMAVAVPAAVAPGRRVHKGLRFIDYPQAHEFSAHLC